MKAPLTAPKAALRSRFSGELRFAIGGFGLVFVEATGVDSVDVSLRGTRAQKPSAEEPPASPRARLRASINGKAVDAAQAREREEKLARGDEGIHAVSYVWKWE